MSPFSLPPPVPVLPEWLLELDLLRGFIWYITGCFTLSMVMRLRFYRAIFLVARHVSDSCPNVYRLLREHWMLCITNGLVYRVLVYVLIVATYSSLNYFVWPRWHTSIADLAHPFPAVLVFVSIVSGIMVAYDVMLIAQVGVIDVHRVTRELNDAERWLGGRLNSVLGFLGKWNPIKKYADSSARESLRWFNGISHTSVTSMIVMLILRLVVAASLFCAAFIEI